MTSEDTRLEGIEMSTDELDAFLRERGHGVLALATENEAYAIPVSFGYDGDRLFMTLLEFGDSSEKLKRLEGTETVCLTVYDTPSRFAWRSVLVRGHLERVDADERDYVDDVLEDNAWRPSMFPPTAPVTGVHRYALSADEVTGRRGSRDA